MLLALLTINYTAGGGKEQGKLHLSRVVGQLGIQHQRGSGESKAQRGWNKFEVRLYIKT